MGEDAFSPLHRGGSGSPLVLVHGFTDTWRGWDLVLPELEGHFDVLAPTLVGHAGAAPLPAGAGVDEILDGLEAQMDEAGFETAHIAGNSLGGYVALKLAERGRARSATLLAPAGGWAEADPAFEQLIEFFVGVHTQVVAGVEFADQAVASPEGRRVLTQFTTVNFEHIPPELLAHQMRGVAACELQSLLELGKREGFSVDPAKIDCPLRFVWGHEDLILRWAGMAARYREDFPDAEWIELEGVGHCPQLDVPEEAARLILEFAAD
jgi:pimeloyl-ACP methyl ester carboxylesterase